MNLRINNLLPLLLVLFLAALTLWLRIAVEQAPPKKAASNRHDADAIVDNFRLVRMSSAGTPAYTMTARRMLHYPDTDTTVLEAPVFLKRGTDGVTMQVTSTSAVIAPDAGEARFKGNVLLRRDAYAGQPALLARTEFLHLLADKDLVRTHERITIHEGSTIFTGVGMELNRATRQFQLHSQVKGHFNAIKRN
jgi:lipopolysaccharide export system protein LptC